MIDIGEIVNLNEEFKQKHTEYLAKSRGIFFDAIEKLFSKYPALSTISWHQYTPFVNNNSEPSIFTAYIKDFSIIFDGQIIVSNKTKTKHEKANLDYSDIIKATETELIPEENGNIDTKKQVMRTAWEEIKNILQAFDSEFYRQLYGDFRWIIITKDGSYSDIFLPDLPENVKIIQETSNSLKKEIVEEISAVADNNGLDQPQPVPIGEIVEAGE